MKALIIASGDIPPKKLIKELIKKSSMIICADGGANTAKKLKLKPDLIIGDFDSVTKSSLKFFKNVPKLIRKDQYSTDLEKAIRYCIQKGITEIDIIGASGKRIDHTIGNIGCFKKFKKFVNLRVVDNYGVLIALNKFIKLKTRKGNIISLIPLNRCTGITTKNLKYQLNYDFLELGVREGTHNVATGKFVEVSCKKGDLLIYQLYRK